jgi:alkanesulfonate monooxygenase SsuD/methylene tetrahydromethanopterin reductase-like flavin-dependent oxidoreductase (luciferase family)
MTPQRSHATTWSAIRDIATRAESLGYDSIFTADHLLATVGDPHQPIFEGWTLIAALAAATDRVRIGPLVLANTFRSPALVAKMAVTLDHVSNGRCVLGLGAGWSALEHAENGIAFGHSMSERLEWLGEATGIIRQLLDGATVTHHGSRYRLENASQSPVPVQTHLPLLIGGIGIRQTLPIVARWADHWNAIGDATTLSNRSQHLDELCRSIERDPSSIRRSVTIKAVIDDRYATARKVWSSLCQHNGMEDDTTSVILGPPEEIAAAVLPYTEAGFTSIVVDLPAPYHHETVERFQGEVLPILRANSVRRRGNWGCA